MIYKGAHDGDVVFSLQGWKPLPGDDYFCPHVVEKTFKGADPRWSRPCLVLEGGGFAEDCGGEARVKLFKL